MLEYLADDDEHALRIVRDLIDKIDWNTKILKRQPILYEEPIYDTKELSGIVSVDYKVPYDVRELLQELWMALIL